jgi:hypothetical protein
MALLVDGSVVMAEVMAFHDRFVRTAKKVDIDGMDVYHTILTNIGDRCLVYKLGDRWVEVSVQHVNMQLAFYLGEAKVLESVFPQKDLPSQINAALRWLLGMPIGYEALPEEVIRIESPEDGKDYSSVDLVVQINSSYEVHRLYDEVVKEGWTYKQDTGGPSKMIGTIAKYQLWVSPLIHVINGVKVLYINPTSGLVQWDMVEEWVAQRVPEGTPTLRCPSEMIYKIRNIVSERKKEAA